MFIEYPIHKCLKAPEGRHVYRRATGALCLNRGLCGLKDYTEDGREI